MATQLCWRVPERSLAWRDFEGEVVAYHEGTGSTHHLDRFGSAVFRVLVAHPAGLPLEALVHEVSAEAPGARREALEADLERTLRELAAHHLATSMPA